MRARFHADPIVQATELLLQERTPRDVAVARPRAEEVNAAPNVRELVPTMLRRFHSPHDPTPRTHLLSNGRYAVMLTAAGSGYSRWRRPRGHALAGGRHLRLLGQLRLPARREQRRGLVGGISAERSGARQLRGGVLRGPSGDRPPRRVAHDDDRGGRLSRGRCRGSPRFDLEPGNPHAGDRADLLRRARAGAARGRRRTSGLLQAVRPDGVRRRRRRPAGHAAAAVARRAPRSGRRTWPSWKARASATCSSRPTGRVSSAAGAASGRRSR